MTRPRGSPAPVPPQAHPILLTMVAVAVGSAAGALARTLLTQWSAESQWITQGQFPWMTWGINLSGSLGLGLLVGWLESRAIAPLEPVRGRAKVLPPWVRNLVGTGFFGGFTTFSTYAVHSLLLSETAPGVAAIYIVATVLSAIAAAAFGYAITAPRTQEET